MHVVCSYSGKHCVVIGGTGRVGGSTASALLSNFPGLKVTLASRSPASYESAVGRRPELKQAQFKSVDINDQASVKASSASACMQCHESQHASNKHA